MLNEIKAVITRSGDTLLEDALGVTALFAVLVAGLSLPGLI
ncbi:hypothetical protein [Szabonella alba]|nr:hypothetical protein [Szabonella alba]